MPKYIDETGKKYGKLSVLYKIDKTNSKREVYWHCKCDCGNEVDVLGRLLRNGTTQSCGCLRGKSIIKNEIGNKYGNLTVISQAEKKINNHVAWNCQCDCGNMIIVSGSRLRNGEVTECSECAKRKRAINEQGHRYGNLLVLEYAGTSINRNGLWKCQCDCGSICFIMGKDLRSGSKTNCGCRRTLSKGAEKIKALLLEHNINFVQEKTFETCRFPDSNQPARFDFYLPDQNIIIEYDGEQHFFYTNHAWDTKEHFEYTQRHDNYKTEWCKNKNIKLIRIPYYDYKNITFDKLSALF